LKALSADRQALAVRAGKRLAFCIPGDITRATGGYRYDREVLANLPVQGIEVHHVVLPGGHPSATATEMDASLSILEAEARKGWLLVDGLALGAMPPDRLGQIAPRLIGLVHHPLGLENGLPEDRARWLIDNEKAVLAKCRHIVVTSDMTARTLRTDFAVGQRKLTVAEPGVAEVARSVGTGSPLSILAVGAISARKAYPLLIEALAACDARGWQLTIIGETTAQPEATTALLEAVSTHGLSNKVTLAGAVTEAELAAAYAKADIFAMSSLYEGYGMALAEALAHGLPIVTSTGGAAADTVPETAALKVAPGDVHALADALQRILNNEALRQRLGNAAWASAALLPRWQDTAEPIADMIRHLNDGRL
jgi:glycosyltransferase involved in cell wall biosynthesis